MTRNKHLGGIKSGEVRRAKSKNIPHIYKKVHKSVVIKTANKLEVELGRKPMAEEICVMLFGNEWWNYTERINALLIRFACLIPRVKRAIISGLKAVDWKGWQLTESEIFHTLNWKDYNVQGKTYEERMAWYEEIFKGKQKPQQIMITLT